jgi:hypothetical protein
MVISHEAALIATLIVVIGNKLLKNYAFVAVTGRERPRTLLCALVSI